jgi:hypothetical protein
MHPRTLPTQIYIRVTRVDERIIRIIIIIGGIADRITTIVVIHPIIVCVWLYTRKLHVWLLPVSYNNIAIKKKLKNYWWISNTSRVSD